MALMVYGSACGPAIYGSCHLIEVTLRRFSATGRRREPFAPVLPGGREVGFLAATVVLRAAGLMPSPSMRGTSRSRFNNGAAAIVIGPLPSRGAPAAPASRSSGSGAGVCREGAGLAWEIQTRLPLRNPKGMATPSRRGTSRPASSRAISTTFWLSTGERGSRSPTSRGRALAPA
jgi:hypothetical protein